MGFLDFFSLSYKCSLHVLDPGLITYMISGIFELFSNVCCLFTFLDVAL